MSCTGVKRRLENTPFSTLGAIPTILRKVKKQRNARQILDPSNHDDPTFVYWIDGMGIGAGYTMVIRIDPNSD